MTDTDVRALLGVFERCQAAADDDIYYADVLTGLRELIPCDDITSRRRPWATIATTQWRLTGPTTVR